MAPDILEQGKRLKQVSFSISQEDLDWLKEEKTNGGYLSKAEVVRESIRFFRNYGNSVKGARRGLKA